MINSEERISLELIFAFTRKPDNNGFHNKVKKDFKTLAPMWINDSVLESLIKKGLLIEATDVDFTNGLGYKLTSTAIALIKKGYSLDIYYPNNSTILKKMVNTGVAMLCKSDKDYLSELTKKVNNILPEQWASEV